MATCLYKGIKMNKKKIAAIASVISYINMENEKNLLKDLRKKAYRDHLDSSHNNGWQCHGIKNIMAGRKFNLGK